MRSANFVGSVMFASTSICRKFAAFVPCYSEWGFRQFSARISGVEHPLLQAHIPMQQSSYNRASISYS
jgi:hypothetical protein